MLEKPWEWHKNSDKFFTCFNYNTCLRGDECSSLYAYKLSSDILFKIVILLYLLIL